MSTGYYPPIIPDGTLCIIYGLKDSESFLNGKSIVVHFEAYMEMDDYGRHECVYIYTPQLLENCCRIIGSHVMPLYPPPEIIAQEEKSRNMDYPVLVD